MTATPTRHRPVALLLLLLLLSGGLILAAAPPGRAESSPLEFSQDGVHWTSRTPTALFRDDVVLAPGGSTTATLHLRSTAPSPGLLELSLTNVRFSAEEAGHAFGVEVRTDPGRGAGDAGAGLPRTRLADLTEGTPVGPPLRLAPGQTARVLVTIDLAPTTESAGAQSTAVGLDLALGFRDAVAGGADDESSAAPSSPAVTIPATAAPGQEASAPSPGPLAVTGFTRTVVGVVAIGLIVAGLLLLVLGRRGTR